LIPPPPIPALAGPWVDSPFFERLLVERGLGEADASLARRFRADGYFIIEGLADDALASRIERETAPLFRPDVADGPRSRYRVQDAWRESGAVRELAGHPRVIEVLRLLYGREPFPFQTLNFLHGSEQHGHADAIHFSSLPARFMCGVWVALEDVTAENGPLFYWPGSHRMPELGPYDLGLSVEAPDYARYEATLEPLVHALGFERRTLEVPRGTALIWASNLVHGGTPIARPGATRRSQVTHYYFEGCIYFTPMFSNPIAGELALKRVLDVRTGRVVAHSFDDQPVRATPFRGPRSLIAFGADTADLRKVGVPLSPSAWARQVADVAKSLVLSRNEGLARRLERPYRALRRAVRRG